MANAGAIIREPLWRDRDFRKLPRLAQCTYMHLLSLKDLDCAGVITLNLQVWIKGCDELTVDALKRDLEALEAARFVFVDYDTDELLVRSYARLVSVRSPNAWKSAMKAALLLESEKLRRELATEFRRLNRADANAIADQLNPSEPPPDPIRNPSEGDNPSGTHSKPPVSVSVSEPESPSVGGYLGGRPHCSKHPNGDSGEACGGCAQVRKWDEQHAELIAADELEKRRVRRERMANCKICGGTGQVERGENFVAKCECVKPREARHA